MLSRSSGILFHNPLSILPVLYGERHGIFHDFCVQQFVREQLFHQLNLTLYLPLDEHLLNSGRICITCVVHFELDLLLKALTAWISSEFHGEKAVSSFQHLFAVLTRNKYVHSVCLFSVCTCACVCVLLFSYELVPCGKAHTYFANAFSMRATQKMLFRARAKISWLSMTGSLSSIITFCHFPNSHISKHTAPGPFALKSKFGRSIIFRGHRSFRELTTAPMEARSQPSPKIKKYAWNFLYTWGRIISNAQLHKSSRSYS